MKEDKKGKGRGKRREREKMGGWGRKSSKWQPYTPLIEHAFRYSVKKSETSCKDAWQSILQAALLILIFFTPLSHSLRSETNEFLSMKALKNLPIIEFSFTDSRTCKPLSV